MTTGGESLPTALRDYVGKVERVLEETGEEPSVRCGIIRDLENQITEMLAEEGMSEDDVRARLDPPETFAESFAGKTRQLLPPPRIGGGIIYCLVALIAGAAIFVEAATHICAWRFFDPMPTKLHLAVLIPVPILLFLSWFFPAKVRGCTARTLRRLMCANGFLIAVSLAYAVVFLQLMPMALIGIVFFGLGLLPLSPSFVLVAAIFQWLQLHEQAKWTGAGGMRKRWLAGFAAATLLLGGWAGYAALMEQAMTKASSSAAREREEGLDRIRLLRGEHYVLARCFNRNFRNWREDAPANVNGLLYYRLTGRDHRGAELPFWYFAPGVDMEARRDGPENIALRSALYDVSIADAAGGTDAGPGTAYAELTLEFGNSGKFGREARCQIIMPPGGVASRLTLWIGGEEREAAFGKKNVVRDAYNSVTRRNLDPALLTAAGPDRVQLQCFPVQPGETMRVKIGFSLPLFPELGAANLRLPYIAERNFALALDRGVSVWAESDAPMTGNAVLLTDSAGNDAGKTLRHAIRGHVAADELAGASIALTLPGAPASYRAELAGIAATSSLVQEEALPERLVAVVLDVSRTCEAVWKPGGAAAVPWEKILANVPGGCRVALFAGDVALPPLSADEAVQQWPEALSRVSFSGADEQAGALERAWDACDGAPGAVVLWLHGEMPLHIAASAGVEQRLRRRPPSRGGPTLFSLQIRPGVNRLEEALGCGSAFVRLESRFDEPLTERLADLFARLAYPALASKRYVFSLDGAAGGSGARFAHAVRLAAAREMEERIAGGGEEKATAGAIDKALTLRLVTAATGAVVLENSAQYKEHSLDPGADAESVPTIPEPEEWAMLAVAVLLIAAAYVRRRKRETVA